MITREYTNADFAALQSASKILASRYRGFAEYDDIRQELFIVMMKKYHKFEEYRGEYSETHAHRMIVKLLRNAGERYCRELKAQVSGYEPDDEFFYSIPMIADMLQLYFDPEWMMPPSPALGKTASGKPPEEGFNLPAMVADVGQGYENLPEHDRALLKRLYEDPAREKDEMACLALEWNCTIGAADRRIRRVLGRIRSQLGGARPR